jgi:hypothetical protein
VQAGCLRPGTDLAVDRASECGKICPEGGQSNGKAQTFPKGPEYATGWPQEAICQTGRSRGLAASGSGASRRLAKVGQKAPGACLETPSSREGQVEARGGRHGLAKEGGEGQEAGGEICAYPQAGVPAAPGATRRQDASPGPPGDSRT